MIKKVMMTVETANELINNAIKSYDLEGHPTLEGGVVWLALCTQKKECNCIDDHFKNGTYNFSTPPFDDHNTEDICQIITHHSHLIELELKS